MNANQQAAQNLVNQLTALCPPEATEIQHLATRVLAVLAPTPPQNFVAAGVVGAVNLAWSAVPGATYTVYRAKSVGGPYMSIASQLTALNYTDKTASVSAMNYYEIRSEVGIYYSAPSMTQAQEPAPPPPPPLPPPPPPPPPPTTTSITQYGITVTFAGNVATGTWDGTPTGRRYVVLPATIVGISPAPVAPVGTGSNVRNGWCVNYTLARATYSTGQFSDFPFDGRAVLLGVNFFSTARSCCRFPV